MNFPQNTFKTVMLTIAGAMIVLAIFQVGVFVGYRKASYSYRWGDNYERMFAGPQRGTMMGFPNVPGGQNGPGKRGGLGGPAFMDAHGISGTVLKIDGDTLLIKDRNDIERAVTVATGTTISTPTGKGTVSDITVDDRIVIIGQPNEQGPIDAKLIRIITQK